MTRADNLIFLLIIYPHRHKKESSSYYPFKKYFPDALRLAKKTYLANCETLLIYKIELKKIKMDSQQISKYIPKFSF